MEKLARYPGLILLVVFVILYVILLEIFEVENPFLRAVVSALIATFLSPRQKIIETNSGKKKQITWIFLKEPIIIDK